MLNVARSLTDAASSAFLEMFCKTIEWGENTAVPARDTKYKYTEPILSVNKSTRNAHIR